MILKNYLLFILKKQLIIKFNFLNVLNNIYINNFYLILPYYLYKLKLNFNIINFYKTLLNLFIQRIYLRRILFKSIFKIKFLLLNFILNIKKQYWYFQLDYIFFYLKYNYNYFIKKKKYIILFNNKMLLVHYNLHNFYKKFYKYDCIIIYKIFLNINNNNIKKYNTYFFYMLLK